MTLKARVIPCLDVNGGRVVKGVNFVNLRDAGDPVESAIAYDHAGADELCFLDITASHEDRGILHIMNDRAWLAVAATGIVWPLLGWLLAGRDDAHRRTLAISADAREVALALVLASLVFPQHSVRIALVGSWTIYGIVSLLLAAGMRGLPTTKAGGFEGPAPVGARSAPAR